MSFLNDSLVNIWKFILDNKNIILTVLGLCVAVIGIYLRSKRKGFSYYIESANSVVRVTESLTDQVEVLFLGKKVENVHLIVINIRNSGNKEIEEKDFKSGIIFNFGENALFLMAAVIETEPPSLDPVFDYIHGKPVLKPLLLNDGDNFIVNFLVSNWDPDAFEVRGRIVGVKDIKLESESSGVNRIFTFLTYIFLALFLIAGIFNFITEKQVQYLSYFIFFLFSMMIMTSRKFKKSYRAFKKTVSINISW